jgi:hexosaminidase
MEISKLNVLHLHLTDAQSFPVLLEDDDDNDLLLSELARTGALRPFGRARVYTLGQLRQIVSYAADRGIEVVPGGNSVSIYFILTIEFEYVTTPDA